MNFDKNAIQPAKHLYIHIPFCKRKCPYCDFYSESISGHNSRLISDYLEALKQEIDEMRNYAGVIETVYIGGGTPSIIGAENLVKLYENLISDFEISDVAEITIEANPDSLTPDFAKTAHDLGFNRISIGAQSFNDDNLKILGRIHNSDQIFQAVDTIKNAGFSNFNLDLITALPEQTISDVLRDLELAVSLNPTHLSVYNLIIEEDTPFERMFSKHEFKMQSNEDISQIYTATQKFLTSKGFSHYEISNFTKQGFESKHNLGYWRYENYIGLGASAQSFLMPFRFANKRSVSEYINNDRNDFHETLSQTQQLDEILMLGLRTAEGIEHKKLAEYCEIYENLNKIKSDFTLSGKLNFENQRIAIKPEFFTVADAIILIIANILSTAQDS